MSKTNANIVSRLQPGRWASVALTATTIALLFSGSGFCEEILIEDRSFTITPSWQGPLALEGIIGGYDKIDIIKDDGMSDSYGFSFTLLTLWESSAPDFVGLENSGSDLDLGADWYIGSPGQVFSVDSIADGTHDLFDDLDRIRVSVNEDVWFGVNTGNDWIVDDATGEIRPERDIFGWVQLRVDDHLNLALVDNAMAFNSSQIVIGRNLIPEPRVHLSALAFIALLVARRRGRRS